MRRGAIILCGGASSRMGRDKAWLPFGPDEVMLQRVVRLVGEVVPLGEHRLRCGGQAGIAGSCPTRSARSAIPCPTAVRWPVWRRASALSNTGSMPFLRRVAMYRCWCRRL